MRQRVYLGLGANLGDRIGHLRWAVRQLAAHEAHEDLVLSPVYESEAHVLDDAAAQPAYLNAVMGLKTTLPPRKLLQLLNHLEKLRGRNRSTAERWASRTLDIDILAYGRRVVQSSKLQIPHRRLGQRRFVLKPWADIAPQFLVPAPYGLTVQELLAQCRDNSHLKKTSYKLLD